jgi:hypothetical protein
MRSKVLRPSREDSTGRRDCVDDDLGSLERHCSDTSVRPLSSSEEYRGGAMSLLARRVEVGRSLGRGTSKDERADESLKMIMTMNEISLQLLADPRIFDHQYARELFKETILR